MVSAHSLGIKVLKEEILRAICPQDTKAYFPQYRRSAPTRADKHLQKVVFVICLLISCKSDLICFLRKGAFLNHASWTLKERQLHNF